MRRIARPRGTAAHPGSASQRDKYRLSFGSVAEAYERARPLYAVEALEWLRGRLPLRRVVDVGAGTGKLSRQLAELGADVVAVEPDADMRAVFARVLPDIELLAGSAEELPLADASVDVATVAQAFHWFDLERALPELHRVIRPGGGIAVVWNEWNDEDERMRALNGIVKRKRLAEIVESGDEHPLTGSPLFENRELRKFEHMEDIDIDTVVERVSSVSLIVNLPQEQRERVLGDVRALFGEGPVRFHLVTMTAVADRA
jgi:ubiquinone/menaquinone biosynthesis C-methylase UbiE